MIVAMKNVILAGVCIKDDAKVFQMKMDECIALCNACQLNVVETITPRDVYILEGLFVLYDEKIRDLCDILVFVDTDADIRFIRRLKRDIEERGRSIDSVCNQYLETVRPMHEQFVEPSKKYAHIIIPEGGNNTVAIDLLITKISSVIDAKE